MAEVRESDAQFGQAILEAAERGGGARVYDRRLGAVNPISRDHPMKTEVDDVDRRNGHGRSVSAVEKQPSVFPWERSRAPRSP